jgi:hypothetical protein
MKIGEFLIFYYKPWEATKVGADEEKPIKRPWHL